MAEQGPAAGTNGQMLAEHLMSSEPEDVRGVTFHIPATGPPVPALYPHQAEALARLRARPVSTILHLPTGSGKTRIALELIAQIVTEAPGTKIVWASYPTTLIRQSMVRIAQFSSRLPTGLRFTWAHSDTHARRNRAVLSDHDVVFVLRGTLTNLLSNVGDHPRASALRRLLGRGTRLVIIYDECHQLGARRLQRGWRILRRKLPEAARWPRVLGLSATPLPRNSRRRILLRKELFPLSPGAPRNPRYPWRMDVAHRVMNAELEQLGVLCPVNAYQQRSGFFDLPSEVLDRATWRRPIEEPAAVGATSDALLRFSGQFNARVMSHPLVLRFLAGRVATRLEKLGKTLVFLPTIRSANAFVALLDAHPATQGRVFLVHARLAEVEREGEPLQVYEQLSRFAAQGDRPCVMVNVNMLTTGFDDPKIRTIVLARLTYSMNLYWQMIGRGSRGPKSGGTEDCTVIDPIRLTRLYPIADGYRPTLTRANDELVAGEDIGAGRLDPSLSIVERSHGGPGPGPGAVDESWFDAVELDEELLTAYQAPAPKRRQSEREEIEVHFDAPIPLAPRSPPEGGTRGRLRALAMALEGATLQRVGTAFGVPFAGFVSRDDAVDELLGAVIADGRRGASTFFDSIPAPELRRHVLSLALPARTNRKAAFVTTLIHDYLLTDPLPPIRALLAVDGGAQGSYPPGSVYRHLDRRYDKRGLQKLLDRIEQPRSAKNKRVLIRRIFETFLWRELIP